MEQNALTKARTEKDNNQEETGDEKLVDTSSRRQGQRAERGAVWRARRFLVDRRQQLITLKGPSLAGIEQGVGLLV